MLKRNLTESGQKARHISSPIDRTLPYKDWIRDQNIDGFLMDIDSIKWKRVNGIPVPCAIMELTTTTEIEVGTKYLDAITNRYFNYELQGVVIQQLLRLLNVPAFIVLFNESLDWLRVYSFETHKWQRYTKEEWSIFLKQL
jgi:hypothetical protein